MGLYSIDNGTLYWKCHNPKPMCGTNIIHISDEGVQWVSQTEVSLPSCPTCGETRMLKVVFDEAELQADNMIQYGMVPTEMTLPHAITGEQIPVMIPALKPIGANPAIARHQELAEQLKAIGKHPPQ